MNQDFLASSQSSDHGWAFYYQGDTTPTAEWNTHVDLHAAKEVFAACTAAAEQGLESEKLPIVCSLDTTERFELQPEFLGCHDGLSFDCSDLIYWVVGDDEEYFLPCLEY